MNNSRILTLIESPRRVGLDRGSRDSLTMNTWTTPTTRRY